jgi:hypothetical protein
VFSGTQLRRHVFRSYRYLYLCSPSSRASSPIACNRHIPRTAQSALPIGLCEARWVEII